MRNLAATRGAWCYNGSGTEWSHHRPATGNRTPNPAGQLAGRAAPASGCFGAAISLKGHMRSKRKAQKHSRQRGCAGCAYKHAAKVAGIAARLSSPELLPKPVPPTIDLTRPADCKGQLDLCRKRRGGGVCQLGTLPARRVNELNGRNGLR